MSGVCLLWGTVCPSAVPALPPRPDLPVPSHSGGVLQVCRRRRAHHADLWCLKRSCPCSFRLICDETNMVHFFSGVKSHLGEHPGPMGLWGGALVWPPLGTYTEESPCPLCVGGFGYTRRPAILSPAAGHAASKNWHSWQDHYRMPAAHCQGGWEAVAGSVGKNSPTLQGSSDESHHEHGTAQLCHTRKQADGPPGLPHMGVVVAKCVHFRLFFLNLT